MRSAAAAATAEFAVDPEGREILRREGALRPLVLLVEEGIESAAAEQAAKALMTLAASEINKARDACFTRMHATRHRPCKVWLQTDIDVFSTCSEQIAAVMTNSHSFQHIVRLSQQCWLQNAIRQADAIPALLGLLKSALTRNTNADTGKSSGPITDSSLSRCVADACPFAIALQPNCHMFQHQDVLYTAALPNFTCAAASSRHQQA